MRTNLSKERTETSASPAGSHDDVLLPLGNAQYSSVVELLPQAVWMADAKGNVIHCNKYWQEFSGLSVAQTAKDGWVSIVHPEDRPRALAQWRDAIATGASNQGEYRFRRAHDGEYRWHLVHSVPMQDGDGSVVLRVGLAVDIHAQKATEMAVQQKDDQLRLALEAARLGTWDYSLDNGRFRSSYRSNAIVGFPPDVELTAKTFAAILHPGDRRVLREAFVRATRPEGLSEFEIHCRIRRPDGAVRWIAARGKGIFSGAGSQRKPVGLTGTIQDITEKKQAEQALQASEARFRTLIENSSDAIVLLDEASRVTYASPSTQRILGYTPGEIAGLSGYELCHPEDRGVIQSIMGESLRNPGRPVTGSARFRHKDGTWRVLEGVLTNLLRDPQIGAIVNNYRDITGKVQSEQALRDSEEKFRRAFHSNPDAMTITTLADGVYLDVNDAFLRITGFTREEVVGRKSFDIGIWADVEDRSRVMQIVVANGRLESMETRFRRKNGEIVFVHFSAELIEIGNVQCVLASSVPFPDGKARYEHQFNCHSHHQMVCTECDASIEFSSPELGKLEEEIGRKYHFDATRHNFQIYGICEDCREKTRKAILPDS